MLEYVLIVGVTPDVFRERLALRAWDALGVTRVAFSVCVCALGPVPSPLPRSARQKVTQADSTFIQMCSLDGKMCDSGIFRSPMVWTGILSCVIGPQD